MSRSHIRIPQNIGGNGTPGMELMLHVTTPKWSAISADSRATSESTGH